VIILDASALIAALLPEDPHHQRARSLILGAVARAEDLRVNTVTLAEVLVRPIREHRDAEVMEALAFFGVLEAPLPDGAARALALLRVDTGLKLPDCCVLLAAIDRHATLGSFDDRLLRAATEHGVPVTPTP
jgi:predicted nucleic acid-binding protein